MKQRDTRLEGGEMSKEREQEQSYLQLWEPRGKPCCSTWLLLEAEPSDGNSKSTAAPCLIHSLWHFCSCVYLRDETSYCLSPDLDFIRNLLDF